ncbi:MAG: hypothetical protein LBG21_01185 [Campylobacteraceae bacterium]|jgi:hypothetical protein|nr:hypothetical protein [Campylobacteraceae bacterium]
MQKRKVLFEVFEQNSSLSLSKALKTYFKPLEKALKASQNHSLSLF